MIYLARFFFFIIDPLSQHGTISYKASRVMYELIYSSIVSFYLCLMIIWIGVYTSFKMELNPLKLIGKNKTVIEQQQEPYRTRTCRCTYQYIKVICIIVLICVFPIQICYSYYVSDRDSPNETINSVIFLIVILVLIVLGFTLFYTITLKTTLNKRYRSDAHIESIEVRVIPNYITGTEIGCIIDGDREMVTVRDNDDESKEDNIKRSIADKELIGFLEEMYQKNCIELVDSCIRNKKERNKEIQLNIGADDDVLIRLDIEKETKYLDDIDLYDLQYKKYSTNLINLNNMIHQHREMGSARDASEEIPLTLESNNNKVINTNGNLNTNPNTNFNTNFNTNPNTNTNANANLNGNNNNNNNTTFNKSYTNTIERKFTKKTDKNSLEMMELTATDMKNLETVFYTSYFILSTTLLVIIFVTLLGLNVHTDNPSFVIWILVFQFVFELCGFFAIFSLFVRDIKTQEYENLKSIAGIQHFLKGKEDSHSNNKIGKALLFFRGISMNQVWARFKSYISLYKPNDEIVL